MLLFSKFRIYGHSMSPFLKDGDLIIISYVPLLFRKPKINDVVAISYNRKIIIKRIKQIHENKYFLEGDNKKDSFDSRKFGYVLSKDIVGRLIFKLK